MSTPFLSISAALGGESAVVALHEDNVLDKMIAALPESDKKELIVRYASIRVDPTSMTFIDRMVADSRSVALKHTAGLSLPQQTQMALFALFFMLDTSISYINGTKETLNARLHDLYQSLGLPIEYDPAATNYYATVDVLSVAQQHYGNEFAKHLEETYTPLSFVFALAEEKSIVVLPGGGFDAPTWSVRVSLANLKDADYVEMGKRMREVLDAAYDEFRTDRGS